MRSQLFLALALGCIAIGAAAEEPKPPRDPAARRARTDAEAVDARLRELEAMNRAILERLDRSEREREAADERYRSLEGKYDELRRRVSAEGTDEEGPGTSLEALPDAVPEAVEARRSNRAEYEPSGDLASEGSRRPGVEDLDLQGIFGSEGFGFKSLDDEYQLRFRVLDQTDFKVFSPGNQVPATSGLYIPRVRIYFEGNLTRLFDYEVSIQRSVEGVWDLLDGNVDINIDPRFRLKFGRTLVPYSYDWYDHLEQYFITPERSLFPLNFGLSRSVGLMAHGRLFDGRLQYAVGGFDGHLVGLADDNTTRDVVSYINTRPFLRSEEFPLLRDLNLGISGYMGQQIAPQAPLPMRTSIQSSENDEAAARASSVFLEWDDRAFLLGGHSALAAHIAWYVGGLSFEAEWQGSRDRYALSGGPLHPLSVPVKGNHFTLAYFLTGEKVRDRSRVDPLHPFDPAKHSWGPGAIELFARYSELQLGDELFRAGLADPNKWTNGMGMTDIGLNWYLTSYIKIYLDWQRSYYDTPVQLNENLRSLRNDLFWIRGQLYY
ncbi:OprO/OprP family phosphate-selective porin [Paludisphaera rhizosphaerae]|uniref:OprO/OprP family phosphate-selective porin n=1 Tax=Paludisphaera rhizosphaerae TaxID=2711216 RepID=UPI0013EBDAA0|nr:porin [Paludisphaera rhizosphaerae]